MIKGFVFGKFMPFHKGHEAMIHFALKNCDFLTVLVCCSDQEKMPETLRLKWIKKSFEGYQNIEIISLNYLEKDLPNSSVSSKEVSKLWSEKFKTLFPDYSVVITSEDYGNYVASYMGIQHIAFDIPRHIIPVTATAVRNDLFTHWKFLPDSVKPDFAIKIILLGTESTGKTTLAEKLTNHYKCSSVEETARSIIAHSNTFSIDDLHQVVHKHATEINKALLGESPMIIIDTDVHITKSYAKFTFGKHLEVEDAIHLSNKADLYLYLRNDVAYVQDGTRLSIADRNALDASHRDTLHQHHIDFIEIEGDWEERFQSATRHINQLLKERTNLSIDYK